MLENAIKLICTATNLEEACEMENVIFWEWNLTPEENEEILTIIGQLYA